MRERLKLDENERREYETALRDARSAELDRRLPARIRAYFFQVKRGSRTPREATRKINQMLDHYENKRPDLVEYYTTPALDTKVNPIISERNRIISPALWADLDSRSKNR